MIAKQGSLISNEHIHKTTHTPLSQLETLCTFGILLITVRFIAEFLLIVVSVSSPNENHSGERETSAG